MGSPVSQPPSEALHEIVKKYGPLIYSRCLVLLKGPHSAEDAVQDVYVKIMKSLHTFREESQHYTWIYRLATNHCIDLLRSRQRNEKRRPNDTIDIESFGALPSDVNAKIDLEGLLKHISPEESTLLFYYYVDEMTLEEIATVTHKNRKTVGRKLQTIIEKLRKYAKS